MAKTKFRAALLSLRGALTPEQRRIASEAISNHLKTYVNERQEAPILGFWPFRGEPDLRLIWEAFAAARSLGLPWVDRTKGAMIFRRYEPGTPLVRNRYGIMEPPETAPVLNAEPGSILLLPCVGADREGYRLGYGGGYYDRFLAKAPDLIKIGVVFDATFVEKIPAESHDQKLDGILSESGFLWFR